MTSWLLVLVLLCAVIVAAWFAGRTGAQKDVAQKNAKIKDKQLEAALDKPDKSELVDRLRDGGKF